VALKTQGTMFKREGVDVAEVTGFTGPDGEANEIDVTHLRSTAKEYLQGLGDEGNIAITGWVAPDDPGQIAMRADRDAQIASTYSLTLTDGTVLTFEAFCKQFGLAAAPDGAVALNVALRITGPVTWT
jgi:hypothetical protein